MARRPQKIDSFQPLKLLVIEEYGFNNEEYYDLVGLKASVKNLLVLIDLTTCWKVIELLSSKKFYGSLITHKVLP